MNDYIIMAVILLSYLAIPSVIQKAYNSRKTAKEEQTKPVNSRLFWVAILLALLTVFSISLLFGATFLSFEMRAKGYVGLIIFLVLSCIIGAYRKE